MLVIWPFISIRRSPSMLCVCLLPPAFPRGVAARHLYGGPRQGSAHGSNALFLRSCAYGRGLPLPLFTQLPRRGLLGNSVIFLLMSQIYEQSRGLIICASARPP